MPESIRRLALADLDDDVIDRLIVGGETLFVERKEQLPSDGLGPTAASLANTLGGWILLGVDNDGRAVGWQPPGRAEPQDHLRELLRREALPPFSARAWVREGNEITIVRVGESFDTPHLVSRTGAVFVREPGGKRPIRDHRELVELARRGERARELAQERLSALPLVAEAMARPAIISGERHASQLEAPLLEWIVYGTPLSVSGEFADRAIARSSVE